MLKIDALLGDEEHLHTRKDLRVIGLSVRTEMIWRRPYSHRLIPVQIIHSRASIFMLEQGQIPST